MSAPRRVHADGRDEFVDAVVDTCIRNRYVGYSYESPDQRVPVLDAKGIEMVRRDS